MDYKILSVDSAGSVSLSSGSNPERVSGIQALVQVVLIELLSSFDPRTSRGSDLIKNANDVAIQDPSQFKSIAAKALNTAQAHIIANQSQSQWLSTSERLIKLEMLDAKMNSGTFSLAFKLTNADNQDITVQLPL
jgi:hypothetical protein